MKQLRILIILMAVLLVTSCNKEDQATGTGDAIIIVKKSGTETVYGLSLYAYTFSNFTNVSVVDPDNPDKTYTLTSTKGNFSYETPEDKYTTTKPAAGSYTFSATFENGVQQVFQNTLLDTVLSIPTFEKCIYNEIGHQLEINWTILDGATSYAINILDGSKIIFASNELKTSDVKDVSSNTPKAAYAVRFPGGGWAAGFTPVSGKTYTVRLFAYMFEPQGGYYNVQCISMADSAVVWGN